MPQIGVGVSITLPYGRIGVTGGSTDKPDVPEIPGNALTWRGEPLAWRGEILTWR